jgi:hypothetical protein
VEESLRLVGVEGCAPNLLSVSRVFFFACITTHTFYQINNGGLNR